MKAQFQRGSHSLNFSKMLSNNNLLVNQSMLDVWVKNIMMLLVASFDAYSVT